MILVAYLQASRSILESSLEVLQLLLVDHDLLGQNAFDLFRLSIVLIELLLVSDIVCGGKLKGSR